MDITVPDFPPVGKRGAVSAEEAGVAASYPFRLCGDQWSLDFSCNKHWIKIHLCYKGWSVCLSLCTHPCDANSFSHACATQTCSVACAAVNKSARRLAQTRKPQARAYVFKCDLVWCVQQSKSGQDKFSMVPP